MRYTKAFVHQLDPATENLPKNTGDLIDLIKSYERELFLDLVNLKSLTNKANRCANNVLSMNIMGIALFDKTELDYIKTSIGITKDIVMELTKLEEKFYVGT